ncbi:MAG: hypothetical protein GKR88_01670 [Flavobacteriaceae bacterium]|nr:MAG: hypothetical protein GKR88_01670 [Flavobacteriaceae bacterium]
MTLLKHTNTHSISQHPYYKTFKLSVDIASKLIHNYHPVDLFNYLDNTYYKKSFLNCLERKPHETIGVLIHGINLIQSNFIDIKKTPEEFTKNPWINFEQFKQLNTLSEWNFFIGLIYQSDPTFIEDLFPNIDFSKIHPLKNNLEKVQSIFSEILTALVEIRDYTSNLTEENIGDNFIGYMKIITKTVEKIRNENSQLDDYLELADYVLNIYDNTGQRQFMGIDYFRCIKKDDAFRIISIYPPSRFITSF